MKKSKKREGLFVDCDTVAIVITKVGKNWDLVNATPYTKDGKWICGLNLVTSIDQILDEAERNGLNIIFESQLKK